MQRIEVGTYPLAGPTFDTPEEAIRHAEESGPLVRARRDAEQLIGSQIVDGFWTETDFVIRFSNDKILHVYVHPTMARRNLDWRIVEAVPDLAAVGIRRIGAPAVELSFQKAGTYVMDCSRMMAARRGRDFKQFYANADFFYLYTPRQLILWFGCIFRKDTGANMLYVFEGD